MSDFPTPGPISLRVIVPSGSVQISAVDTTTTTVQLTPGSGSDEAAWRLVEESRVEMLGDELLIEVPERGRGLLRRTPDLQLRVELPTDSRIRLSAGSADLTCSGRLAEAETTTASGDVQIAEVTGDLTVKTASGDIRVDHAHAALRVHSASGDVEVDRVDGTAEIAVASGDTRINDAGGSVQASSASGDVAIRCAHRGAIAVKTASGDVRVGVAPGVGVYLDLSTMSGDARSELTAEDAGAGDCDLNLQVRTMTGDINVARAR